MASKETQESNFSRSIETMTNLWNDSYFSFLSRLCFNFLHRWFNGFILQRPITYTRDTNYKSYTWCHCKFNSRYPALVKQKITRHSVLQNSSLPRSKDRQQPYRTTREINVKLVRVLEKRTLCVNETKP